MSRGLILNGSPRSDGNSMCLASAMLEVFGGGTVAHLYREDIRPCLGCGRCDGGAPCFIDDAMPRLLALLSEARLVVVASPLHFTSLTAPVIAFYSRLQPFWRARRAGAALLPEGDRRGALAVTAGSEYANMFAPARSVTAAAFNTLPLPFAGMATAAGTDAVPAKENAVALNGARELAAAMVESLGDDSGGGGTFLRADAPRPPAPRD